MKAEDDKARDRYRVNVGFLSAERIVDGTTDVPVVRVKSIVRVPWRLRLRWWWMRRRMSPAALAAVDEISRRETEAFLFGKAERTQA